MQHDNLWLVFFTTVFVMLVGVYFFKPERIRDHTMHRLALAILVLTFFLQLAIPIVVDRLLKRSQPTSSADQIQRLEICNGVVLFANYFLVVMSLYVGMTSVLPPSKPSDPNSNT